MIDSVFRFAAYAMDEVMELQKGIRSKARTAERFVLLSFGLFLLSCLVGLYLGYLLARQQATVVAPELRAYLGAYSLAAERSALSAQQVLQTFFLYYRYPMLAFLLGFASFGILLIPPLSALLTFSFSYAVCCFTASFGSKGIALAASLLGLRYCLTLPCFFVLAAPSLRTSWELTRCTLGQSARRTAILFDRTYFLRFFIVAAILAAGAMLDLWLAPWLLSLAAA